VTGAHRDDEELIRAHVAGDRDAFALLFQRHRDRLWAVALRTTADREEAADALQDALLSAHRAAPRFRGDSAVTTWLHRIVVNACLDRLRRRQAHPTVPLADGGAHPDTSRGPEPAAPVVDHDTALVVRAALAKLPPEQRAAIVLVDLHGYPVAEVAEILGVAEGTVKSRCARGRLRLATLLGHLRTDDGPASGDRGNPPHPAGMVVGPGGRSALGAEPNAGRVVPDVRSAASGNRGGRGPVTSRTERIGGDEAEEVP
jgi:RNA polymerase sigma-70 factor, ECF subfamily